MARQDSDRSARIDEAIRLMTGFAERTGIDAGAHQTRYLWTDAFAVCNYLGLSRATGEQRHAELALRLIDRVHHTLGKHRNDDGRTGWLSGLPDQEAEAHPTRGGLRIGKKLPERPVGEPMNDRLEWDRDGQYFHYLTKWMHGLDQASRVLHQPLFNRWARELAEVAHRAFRIIAEPPRLAWKMSIDLGRPLVASMGQHDPLDGFITCVQLQEAADDENPSLAGERDSLRAMMQQQSRWASADPLGLGGLLMDACRVTQLVGRKRLEDDGLLASLLEAALLGLRHYEAQGELDQPPSRRLAFRELGLAIGLRALAPMNVQVREALVRFRVGHPARLLSALGSYASLGAELVSFWRSALPERVSAAGDHRDIDEVMLATSLVPDGFLLLGPVG